MNTEQIKMIHGKIDVIEMILTNKNYQLDLLWEIYYNNTFLNIIFYNISRLSMENISLPFEIHGFEIIDQSQNGWEEDSKYEIRDFEDGCINFFCKSFEMYNQ